MKETDKTENKKSYMVRPQYSYVMPEGNNLEGTTYTGGEVLNLTAAQAMVLRHTLEPLTDEEVEELETMENRRNGLDRMEKLQNNRVNKQLKKDKNSHPLQPEPELEAGYEAKEKVRKRG